MDKEERWLNDMSREGYHLTKKGLFYQFEEGKPSNHLIRMDYRKFKTKEHYVEYVQLFKDSGWRKIAGHKNSGEQYFEKIDSNATNEIFSDNSSRAMKYKRYAEGMLSMFGFMLVISIIIGLQTNQFLNPSDLYLTPGLWEKEGMTFWRAFLFETPFAFMRGLGGWGILIIGLLFLFGYYRANKKAKQLLEEN